MRVLLVALALVLLSGAGTLAVLVESTPEPTRMIVGLRQTPSLAAGETVLGEEVVYVEPVLRFVVVETDAVALLRARAAADPDVRYVEEDTDFWLSAWIPSDPFFPAQYGPQQVRAPEAWEVLRGGEARTLCVVDSGLRWTHEELRDGRYRGGWDFIGGDAEPYDEIGHGTHVLGIAAAGLGNARGIAGIAEVPFYVARSAANNTHPTSALASAIRWCADVGADVINLSVGAKASTTLREAVVYAHAAGALLVAAAGNQNDPCDDCIDYPAAWPEAMAVTCTGPTAPLDLAREASFCDFSKAGPEADLAAPGDDILSSMTFADDRYYVERGTSMSAPHVAGAALLVWNARPELPARLVWEALVLTARDLGEPGHDRSFGWGLLDVGAAVRLVAPGDLPACLVASPLLGEAPGAQAVVWTDEETTGVRVLADGVEITALRLDEHRWSAPLPPSATRVEAVCQDADGDARESSAYAQR